MIPIAFMAKCQSVSIRKQYELGVRCFDLRIRFKDMGYLVVSHGCVVYDISEWSLLKDLEWLDGKGGCYVRVIHEARNRRQRTERSIADFRYACKEMEMKFRNIRFWCGRNLYNWQRDYNFGDDPECEEKYSSVCRPKLVDDWWPWLYAKMHNRRNLLEGARNILLIDFVNIK